MLSINKNIILNELVIRQINRYNKFDDRIWKRAKVITFINK